MKFLIGHHTYARDIILTACHHSFVASQAPYIYNTLLDWCPTFQATLSLEFHSMYTMHSLHPQIYTNQDWTQLLSLIIDRMISLWLLQISGSEISESSSAAGSGVAISSVECIPLGPSAKVVSSSLQLTFRTHTSCTQLSHDHTSSGPDATAYMLDFQALSLFLQWLFLSRSLSLSLNISISHWFRWFLFIFTLAIIGVATSIHIVVPPEELHDYASTCVLNTPGRFSKLLTP